MEQLHVSSVEDLASIIPGLAISAGGGPGQNFPIIRGISSFSGASTVAIYINDTPIAIPFLINTSVGEPDLRLFDLSRLEVLKGPQGTLYGASSLGGTIKYVTAEPSLEKSSQTYSATLSNTAHAGLNNVESGIINIPLVPNVVALQVGLQYEHDAGYVDHLENAPVPGYNVGTTSPLNHTNDNSALSANLTLAIQPLEHFKLTPSLLYQKITVGDLNFYNATGPEFVTSRRINDPHTDEIYLPALTLQYQFDWGALTSSTSYFSRTFTDTKDVTGLDSVYQGQLAQAAEGSGGAFVGNLLSAADDRDNFHNSTEEIRLVSNADRKLLFTVGAYFNQSVANVHHVETSFGTNAATQQLYNLTPEQVFGVAFPDDVVFKNEERQTTTEWAVFGQVGYRLTSALTATIGLRHFSEAFDDRVEQAGLYAPSTPFVTQGHTVSVGATPKYALSYQINPSNLVYVSATKGFRIGGTQIPVPQNICGADLAAAGLSSSPTSYGPDQTWNYELGYKSDVRNKVSVDASLFYIDWNRIQQNVVLPTCGYQYIANVGKVVSRGFDFEVHAQPADRVTLSAAVGHTDSSFRTPDAPLGVNVGDPVLATPRWTASVNGQLTLGEFAGGRFVTRVNYSGQSDMRANLDSSVPFSTLPAFRILGGEIAFETPRWRAALFGTNLLDENSTIASNNSLYTQLQIATFHPRTFGLRGQMKIE